MKNSESVNVKAHLVYHLSYKIEVPHRISRPTFIIDANTGEIVKQWEGLSLASWKKKKKKKKKKKRSHVTETPLYKLVEGVGGNKKTGKLYGLDLPELRVTELPNGLCSLENQYALVYSCNSSYDFYTPNMTTHEFDCQKGFNDSVNDGYSPLNDAFFYVGITYEMYAEWYGASDPLHYGRYKWGHWMVGYDIWKKANESMRYFDDPEKDGGSIAVYSDYCFFMDTHFSSGLYNRAFYILSNMPGWCVRQALHVFFLANDLSGRPTQTSMMGRAT